MVDNFDQEKNRSLSKFYLYQRPEKNLVKKLTRFYMVSIYFDQEKSGHTSNSTHTSDQEKPGQKSDMVLYGRPILLTRKNLVGPSIR